MNKLETGKRRIPFSIYLALLIFALGAFLRFYRLGTKSLWFDELRTYQDALKNYPLWNISHSLYFKLVRVFLNFGHAEVWLRMFSAICGALGPLAVYLAAKDAFDDRRVGVLSALLIATSVNHVYYSQEARYYPVMFLLAALSLWFFARFIYKGCLISLFLLPVSCLLNYLIHPTTLVLSGLILMFVPFSLGVSSKGRKTLKRGIEYIVNLFKSWKTDSAQKKKPKRIGKKTPLDQRRWFKIFMILVVILIIITGVFVSRKLGKIALRQASNIRLFKSPAPGVSATKEFFFIRHFIYYGPIVQPGGFVNSFIVAAFILFSIVGYARAIIKRFPFGSLCVISIFATFTLLFSTPLKQWYSNKYVFFLYPVNILCVSYGAVSVLDALIKLVPEKLKAQKSSIAACLCLLFLAPSLYKDFLQVRRYYADKGTDIKGAARFASNRMEDNDVISSYGVITEVVSYYANYYGIPPERVLPLEGEKGDGSRSISLLLKAAANGGNLWHIYGWPHDMRSSLNSWVEEHFDEVFRSQVSSDDEYDVILWKWKYKDRFLSEKTTVSLGSSLRPVSPDSSPDNRSGWLKSVSPIYVHHDMNARLRYSGDKIDPQTFWTIRVYVDESESAVLENAGDKLIEEFHAVFPIQSGARKIELLFKPHGESRTPQNLPFVLESANRERIFRHAVDFDVSSPSYDIGCKTENGASFVFTPYNSFVGYNVSVPDEGTYNLAIKVRNGSSLPMLYQVDVDGKPAGLLSYNKKDLSWEEKSFPVSLTSGERLISLYYVSNILRGERNEKENNDSLIQRLYLEKMSEGKVLDQRIVIPHDVMITLSEVQPLVEMNLGDKDKRGWTSHEIPEASVVEIRKGKKTFNALYAEIPPETKKAGFLSPLIPVKQGQLLYFSVKAAAENLQNHSANLALAYMDDNRGIIGAPDWINAQGIMEDVPETKFICFRTIPPNVKFVAIQLVIYENSRKPFKTTGRVWFYDFQSDVQLTTRR